MMTLYSSRCRHVDDFRVYILLPLLRQNELRQNVINSAHVLGKCSSLVTPALRWREPRSCLAPGGETDGSSCCRSEHRALERSLQSVVPVLNIDGSKTLPRYRAG